MNTLVEYIWIGGNKELRSKTRVYKKRTLSIKTKEISIYAP